MATVEDTVSKIIEAPTWNQRIAEIRLIPEKHGIGEHQRIYALVAQRLYVSELSPDFAFIPESDFYKQDHFEFVYEYTVQATDYFNRTSTEELAEIISSNPCSLLVFRTIAGLTRDELSKSTMIFKDSEGTERTEPISSSKLDSMERKGARANKNQNHLLAATLNSVMNGELFGSAPPNFRSKQQKPDTEKGWETVRKFALQGVPYSVLLHQRHYGGSFRQVLDATSSKRGVRLEDAVETLFKNNGIPYVRTGSSNQGEIAKKFGITVTPSPDFVIHDQDDRLKAVLECKLTNDGGTARDKASRFNSLREESVRLGGVPVIAVLGGLGWERINDALGPVIRATEGRVFTLSCLSDMLQLSPFQELIGFKS
jgi:hypothetical protein